MWIAGLTVFERRELVGCTVEAGVVGDQDIGATRFDELLISHRGVDVGLNRFN